MQKCAHCEKMILISQNRRFCSIKCHDAYWNKQKKQAGKCYFCGTISFNRIVFHWSKQPIYVCYECSGALAGTIVPKTELLTAKIIYAHLKHKYEKFLIPQWNDNELDKLTGQLYNNVYDYASTQQHILPRLNYLETTFNCGQLESGFYG